MIRKLAFIMLALVFTVSCGSPSKSSKNYSKSKKKHKNYSYYDSGDPANQDSIEDVIYSELSKRQRALLQKYRIPTNTHSLGGVKFDIPMTVNDRVTYWIDYFTNGSGRKHYARYLSRSTRFVPTQLRILKEVGVPRDLIFLSMIESGFNTHAYSTAAASGLWQFIRSTGRLYGLDSDYWVDERRDPEKATLAAANHLKDLYGEFGDWYLAFAAYNAGSGKVRRAIAGVGSNNFWDLARSSYLRQETKDYVPKLLAAAIIGKSPEKYGFDDVIFQDPIAVDKVTVTSPTDIEVIAECAGVDADLIRLINPELVRNMTPPDRSRYQLNVPRGTASTFERKYARLSPSERLKNVQYIARSGDTLRSIAAENGVSVANLTNANPGLGHRLNSGQTVIIPRTYDSPPALTASSAAYPTATKGSRLLDLIAENHEVKIDHKKNKKKKEKEQKLIATQAVNPEAEMKVAWREPNADSSVKADLKAPEAESSQPAVVPAASTEVASDSPKADFVANAGSPESSPSAENNVGSTDAQIAEALNKVEVNAEPNTAEDSSGAVRVKSTGQVAELDKNNRSKKSTDKVIKVKRGDTLTSLADRYNVSVADLKQWNKLKAKGNVLVGQKLVVKGSPDLNTEAVKPKTSPKIASKKSSASKVIAYKVRKGDTINKIAKKYDASPTEIMGMNGLSKKDALKPGVVLKIKSKNNLNEG